MRKVPYAAASTTEIAYWCTAASGRTADVRAARARARGAKTRRPLVPLGQLCIELGFLSATELGRVLSQHGRRLLLGELLALTGVITPAQLQAALGQQLTQGPKKSLGHC